MFMEIFKADISHKSWTSKMTHCVFIMADTVSIITHILAMAIILYKYILRRACRSSVVVLSSWPHKQNSSVFFLNLLKNKVLK